MTSSNNDEPRQAHFLFTEAEWRMMASALALNGLVNGVLPARWHVPASLASADLTSGMALVAGASLKDQGLGLSDIPRGVLYGIIASAPIAFLTGAGVLSARTRRMYAAPAANAVPPLRAAYEAAVRIPVGTALSEEVIFRGALLAVLMKHHRPAVAVGLDSLLFGLWHLTPALRSRRGGEHVAASVGFTFLAGAGMALLRLRSRSVAAPWLVHSAANSSGFVMGWLLSQIQLRHERHLSRSVVEPPAA